MHDYPQKNDALLPAVHSRIGKKRVDELIERLEKLGTHYSPSGTTVNIIGLRLRALGRRFKIEYKPEHGGVFTIELMEGANVGHTKERESHKSTGARVAGAEPAGDAAGDDAASASAAGTPLP